MNFKSILTFAILLASSVCFAQSPKTEIMLFGSAHFGQENFYKEGATMDLFNPARQKDVSAINSQLAAYHPDLILIEREPSEQQSVDSSYQLFRTGKLKLSDLKYGRAEEYQFGYNVAKQLNLPRVYAADFYQSVSTRLFKTGKNTDQFIQRLDAYAALGRTINEQLKEGKINLKQYLLQLNAPELTKLTYYTLYVKPAVIRDGSFGNVNNLLDTARINKDYIGAEYISLLYGRELKIFSNILKLQQEHSGKRILLIMGSRHLAVLSRLFAEMPEYKVIPVSAYVK